MTIRECTALVLLYQGCGDRDLRAKVERLVPELTEWGEHHGEDNVVMIVPKIERYTGDI